MAANQTSKSDNKWRSYFLRPHERIDRHETSDKAECLADVCYQVSLNRMILPHLRDVGAARCRQQDVLLILRRMNQWKTWLVFSHKVEIIQLTG